MSGGRVVAAGPTDDLDALAGRATVRWRLRPGLVVTPSLTDAHLHLALAALAAGQPDLTGLDLAGVAAAVAAAHHRLLGLGDATAGCWATAGPSTRWAGGPTPASWTRRLPDGRWRSGPTTTTHAG